MSRPTLAEAIAALRRYEASLPATHRVARAIRVVLSERGNALPSDPPADPLGTTASVDEVRDLAFKVSDAISDGGCSCDAEVTCPPHDALEKLEQRAIQAARSPS